MRPHKIQDDGNTVASATLFAHNPAAATENLRESFVIQKDKRLAQNRQEQAKKFLAYVIKEWQDEIRTESAIGFEFLG